MKLSRKKTTERVFVTPTHSSRIKHEPKEVRRVRDPATKSLPCQSPIKLEDHLDDLVKLTESIQAGKGADERYYRSSRGKDYLLTERGWLHLHLAGDVLLLCEQTNDAVIFIALVTHSVFEERPRAKSLAGYLIQVAQLKTTRASSAEPPSKSAIPKDNA